MTINIDIGSNLNLTACYTQTSTNVLLLPYYSQLKHVSVVNVLLLPYYSQLKHVSVVNVLSLLQDHYSSKQYWSWLDATFICFPNYNLFQSLFTLLKIKTNGQNLIVND